MAVLAKMKCNRVEQWGGGTNLPLCQAEEQSEVWPPVEDRLYYGSIQGHGEGECERCDELSAGLYSLYATKERRMVHFPGLGREVVELTPVADGSDDNAEWAAATPSGMLELHIDNPAAHGYFVPDGEYMIKVTRHMPQKSRASEE